MQIGFGLYTVSRQVRSAGTEMLRIGPNVSRTDWFRGHSPADSVHVSVTSTLDLIAALVTRRK